MNRIVFGTDGWRAVMADRFTFSNVERLAQATADYWSRNPPEGAERLVIVGYDRRFLSEQFGIRVAEVFAGNGFEVELGKGPMPTPSVSLAVKQRQAAGGVVITASHNPPIFNGYKIKSNHGGAANTALCNGVERMLDGQPVRALPLAEAIKARKIRLRDLRPAHFSMVRRLVDFKAIARSGLRIAHEALYGVGAGCFETLLADTNCRVVTLHAGHDPLFGGLTPEPIPKNYGQARAWLRRNPQDLCLVTDGDADRIGAMDGGGGLLSTHNIMCLLLNHIVRRRGGSGVVVKAITTTSMLDKMCDDFGLELRVAPVGFKYISEEMLKADVLLGAEESGGFGLPAHIPERDGILAGMLLLEMLAFERRPIRRLLADLEKKYGRHCYGRIDAHCAPGSGPRLMEFLKRNPPRKLAGSPLADVVTLDGVKFVAADTSWLMLRASGTEPVLRIYAESSSEQRVQSLLDLGRKLLKAGGG